MLSRILRALSTWPKADEWREVAAIALVAALAIGTVAGLTGLLSWQPRLQWASLLVFVVPAFTEELIFRGPLPSRHESARPILWMAAGVLLFTLWHVSEALTFLPGARLFLEPRFLICAAILGTGCAAMRYRTGSLWPGVVFHGLIVLAWQGILGGPSAFDLMP
ncbi:hypothetical protein ABAC460_19430 [Asticcacaulis sp. AC460]|uniref:CPBP family glutamic-type intramembrane protease n=1 Tax=Asticcacaulis sp. AC460 TaxID=1282360 RepID=UPI0003C3DDBE|nr:CPBP family glutamic-type intramembrane protease [Asticcacaulis sp. AC460]ESQ87501.1 hypothetical protein ABAC460_19430 [Asticcacaulis sp. AC460]